MPVVVLKVFSNSLSVSQFDMHSSISVRLPFNVTCFQNEVITLISV